MKTIRLEMKTVTQQLTVGRKIQHQVLEMDKKTSKRSFILVIIKLSELPRCVCIHVPVQIVGVT